jgi:cobyrinic acid a,c-diamide synthase
VRHEDVIRKAIAQISGLPVLGAVPRQRGGDFPERHMGLTPFQEHPEVEQAINASRVLVERYLDLDALWSVALNAPEMDAAPGSATDSDIPEPGSGVVIGVIRDTAFQFYYPDNLEELERHGAEIREINALRDTSLPDDLDALYIGGGFPETQAAALAANDQFCRSIRAAADKGLPIYAECGGLIYLGRSLSVNGQRYPMTSVFPADFILEKRPQAHGYAILNSGDDSVFLKPGVRIRGHEFHYSRVESLDGTLSTAYHVERGHGIDGTRDGLVYNNVVGAYTHIHALATPQWAMALVQKARAYRRVGRESWSDA